MKLPPIIEAEAAIEAALVAEGWRIAHREPWPPIEMREAGEDAYGTMWWAKKPAGGQEIMCRFDLSYDMLEGEPADRVAEYVVANANAEYDQLVHEGAPA